MKLFLIIGNLIVSGFVTFISSSLIAHQALAENAELTYPEFFIMIPVWFIGALLVCWYFYKRRLVSSSYLKILIVNLLLWITMPIGYKLAVFLVKQRLGLL